MREPPTRLLDELSRVMTGAVGLAQGVQREADSFARSQIERILRDSDLVTREEFDIQSQVLARTREKLKALEARVDALEKARCGS